MSAQHKTKLLKFLGLTAPKVIRRFNKDKDGATAVEFAMIAGPFFFLLTAILESSLYFFAGQMLEDAADRVGRKVRTGQFGPTITQEELKTEVCKEAALLFDCKGLMVDLASAGSFAGLGAPPGPTGGALDPGSYGFSSPGSAKVMRLSVNYEWPIITNYVAAHLADLNSNNALLSAISVFKTEPY